MILKQKIAYKIFFQNFFSEIFQKLFRFVPYFFVVKVKVMNYRRRLQISALRFPQKIQICIKHLDDHIKIFFAIIFFVSKIEIVWKLAKKWDFGKFFDLF